MISYLAESIWGKVLLQFEGDFLCSFQVLGRGEIGSMLGREFGLKMGDCPDFKKGKICGVEWGGATMKLFFEKGSELDCAVKIIGTDFQKKVWRELAKLKTNDFISYTQLASRIKNVKAVRAVANAVGKNPFSVAIPCHRVISKSGGLGGFRFGTDLKLEILKSEGKNFYADKLK